MSQLENLRTAVKNLAYEPLKEGALNQENLHKLGFIKFKLSFQRPGWIGLKRKGSDAFQKLCEQIYDNSIIYSRGCRFEEASSKIFDLLIEHYLDKDPSGISNKDYLDFLQSFEGWFRENSGDFTIYVPCGITLQKSESFSIGSIRFVHIDNLIEVNGSSFGFDDLIEKMRFESFSWIAVVRVSECTSSRSEEMANLASDVAIAALQISVPIGYSQTMVRMTARRNPAHTISVKGTPNGIAANWHRDEPGLAIGPGSLEEFLSKGRLILDAAGKCIDSYLTGKSALPCLHLAWCDAAYWFHQGLAERLDTVAVTKHETSLEILLRSQSTQAARSMLKLAFKAFLGMEEERLINPESTYTVKKLVEEFITDRSRILHGTSSTLTGRPDCDRGSLKVVNGMMLIYFALELVKYSCSDEQKDNSKDFLNWVAAQEKPAEDTSHT